MIALTASIVILPCYIIAQIIVAVKVMNVKKATGLGISILAVLVINGLAAALNFNESYDRHNEGLFIACFGALSIARILMYWAYDKLFKSAKASIA